jgi:hypothetical protein
MILFHLFSLPLYLVSAKPRTQKTMLSLSRQWTCKAWDEYLAVQRMDLQCPPSPENAILGKMPMAGSKDMHELLPAGEGCTACCQCGELSLASLLSRIWPGVTMPVLYLLQHLRTHQGRVPCKQPRRPAL